MLAFSEPRPAISPIIIGLQILTCVSVVPCLVLLYLAPSFYGSQNTVTGSAGPSEDATAAESVDSETDERSDDEELAWIGNETSNAEEPLSFDEDPFSLLHFRVSLPTDNNNNNNNNNLGSTTRVQPVELVFHSSWPITADGISLHVSCDGVAGFRGSYLNQHPRDSDDYYVVHDGGTIQMHPLLSPKEASTSDQEQGWASKTWLGRLLLVALISSLTSIAFGVASSGGSSSSYYPSLWPQEVEIQPLELWDRAWEALGMWADVMEPLMPNEAPHGDDKDDIYTAFHKLPTPHRTVLDLCDQLSFISSSTLGSTDSGVSAGGVVAREAVVATCDAANENLDHFDSEWEDLLSYFSRGWLKRPIQELNSAGFNTSRFQKETGRNKGSTGTSSDFTIKADTKSGLLNFKATFGNQTALRLLALADPSFPELQPLAANMTRRLRSLQAHARITSKSMMAVSDLIPLELHSREDHHREEPQVVSFARQWTGFNFHSWWSSSETASGYGLAPTKRAAGEMARLQNVLKAFHSDMAESVRRAETLESSLKALGQKVAALTKVDKSKRSSQGKITLDGAWVNLGWRADCEGDQGPHSGLDSSRVVAIPVAVAYFVPSAESLFQSMNKTYQLLTAKQFSAIQRRETALAEKEKASDKAWHEYFVTYGGDAMGDEDDCIHMSVDEDGRKSCLTSEELRERMRDRLQSQFGMNNALDMAFAGGGEETRRLGV